MNKKILHIVVVFNMIILFLLVNTDGYSQGIDLYGRKASHIYFGFTLSPSQTSIGNSIVNDSTFTAFQMKSTKRFLFSGSLDAGYTFSKYFGIATGIGLSSYATDLSLDSCKNNYNAIDEDSESYLRRITGKNISESQQILFLNIPVSFRFVLPVNEMLGIFLQTGLNFSIPVSKTYNDEGTFTYTGYYPKYNITLYDISNGNSTFEGFLSNQPVSKRGELKIKTIIPEFISTVGLQFNLKGKVRLSIGAFYNKLLSNISGYSPSEIFKFSNTKKKNLKSQQYQP